MNSRRQALALAGALMLAVLSAVGAIAGMPHRAATPKPATPVVATRIAPPTRATQRWDD